MTDKTETIEAPQRPLLKLALVPQHALLQYLDLLEHIVDQGHQPQLIGLLGGRKASGTFAQWLEPLREHHTVLAEKTPQLVGRRVAPTQQPRAHPVQGLFRLLFDALHTHKVHPWR